MKYELKNYIWANLVAIAGYPLFWYIKEAIQMFKNHSFYGFTWLTSLILCPYIFITIIFILFVFFIEYIFKKKFSVKETKRNYNTLYKIVFYTGFSLYIVHTIFCFLYILYAIINNVFFNNLSPYNLLNTSLLTPFVLYYCYVKQVVQQYSCNNISNCGISFIFFIYEFIKYYISGAGGGEVIVFMVLIYVLPYCLIVALIFF